MKSSKIQLNVGEEAYVLLGKPIHRNSDPADSPSSFSGLAEINNPDPALGAGNKRASPPIWLMLATAILAITGLVLAVAETNLWAHYLIDGGEFLSLFGLGLILITGIYLFSRNQLYASLPLALPWLLYPIITQGDQIIDNLSINPMRVICQVLLAAIFGAPVFVLVIAASSALARAPGHPPDRRWWIRLFPGFRSMTEGRIREGAGRLAAALLTMELWVAYQFLGVLMVVTLILMIVGALVYARLKPNPQKIYVNSMRHKKSERFALIALVASVSLSFGIYLHYKNLPGAYQGSPSAFMDPSQMDKEYPIRHITVPIGGPSIPARRDALQQALTEYVRTLDQLLKAYHILDRNYTYDFHNHLFLRSTPLLANYRAVALQKIEEARLLRVVADAQAVVALSTLPKNDPFAALLEDLHDYVAFNFDRAPVLERMSGEFERTQSGLQHAAHLYEGEGKELGLRMGDILNKYRVLLHSPAAMPMTEEFVSISRTISSAYAHHVVGF